MGTNIQVGNPKKSELFLSEPPKKTRLQRVLSWSVEKVGLAFFGNNLRMALQTPVFGGFVIREGYPQG